ncbi:DDE-type integrase/transposase/recombinase [Burkholderia pyrrocinia]|uniref:DDE-type integrase/transposase/recombinase n=1 Tax=Burkholderia pyrrocinia TaxID=60550 RepID=UPI00158C63B1|nr:DDE-type integrase/transposase/recombinase [Burkholderia pyrrocinia]
MLKKATCPSSIAMGDVLKKRNGDTIYIVLKTGDGQRWTHLIDIEHGKPESTHRASPFKLKTDEVIRRLSFNVEDDDALDIISKLPVSVAERRRAATYVPNRRSKESLECVEEPERYRGWVLIRRLLTFDRQPDGDLQPEPSLHGDEHEALLERSTRAKRIHRFIAMYRYSETTVRRVLRRFWQRGMTPAAAGDDYDCCGGKGKVKNFTLKPGRKSRGKSLSGPARNEEVRKILAIAADYYFTAEYRKGPRASKSMAAAVRWVMTLFARRKVFDADGRLVDMEFVEGASITPRQLQYYIAQNYSYKDRRVRKVGIRRYLLHERPLTGRLSDTRGPGQRFHIDATIIDVYPVSRIMRSIALRRPTLYLVVDDYSRMIVGVHLTFDPPCWNGAMMALVNAISSKVEFCKRLGLDITEGQWPSEILCEELYGDQGEISSVHKAQPLHRDYRVEILNPAAYRPDLRGVIEVRFHILPATWMSLVPGAVEKDSFERGRVHPALDAALDIGQLLLIVVMAILSYNSRAVTGYPTPPEMVEAGEAATPLNLWKYGIKVNGRGRKVDVAEFRSKVIAPEKAVIVANGIKFKRVMYACPLSLIERQAMFRAEGKETVVDVTPDSSDVSNINLLGLGEPIACPLQESEPDWVAGLTYHELEVYRSVNAANIGCHEAEVQKSLAITEYNIAATAKQAVKQTKAALEAAGLRHPDINNLDNETSRERADERTEREMDERSEAQDPTLGAVGIRQADAAMSGKDRNSSIVEKRSKPFRRVTGGLTRSARPQAEDHRGIDPQSAGADITDLSEGRDSSDFGAISEQIEVGMRDLFDKV